MNSEQKDVIVIGAGLAGLTLADSLSRGGHDVALLEARDRPGGRVLSIAHDGAEFDLGPAWFWPGQPRMSALTQRFGLAVFEQYAQGALSFEDERGEVQHVRGYASMQGSLRVAGGLSALTNALASALPNDTLRLNTYATSLRKDGDAISVNLSDGRRLDATHVVLALPPRLASKISFSPALHDDVMSTLISIPTWMAGQAKIVALYETAFWRDVGLSGDAMSRKGPMVEIHDASPPDGPPYALFGFVGVPPSGRGDEARLRQQALLQLARLFGPQAAEPIALQLKDWAQDSLTATTADQTPPMSHPSYGMPPVLADLWNGSLHFAGSEFARDFGGFLEGALEASEQVARHLNAAK